MKNKRIVLLGGLLLIIMISACSGGENEKSLENISGQPSQLNISYNDDVSNNKHFNFSAFNLEVDYVDRLSYEVEYTHIGTEINARINDLDQQKVIGKDAFNQLAPHFQEMSFDEDSSKDEVINEVIKILGLDPTFKEFELDVTYHDGSRIEYES